mmetsp:Transcript_24371/g.41393  ORF Transcript_24371/g.41393 Transcript_24371/m.41393 type:complete len:248 (-) Transcript_24371:61-804(-)
MVELCVILGSVSGPREGQKGVIFAKEKADMAGARQNLAPASLERLELTLKDSEFDECFDPMELSGWVQFLSPGATVSIRVVDMNKTSNLQVIHTAFLLAGLSGASERREADGSVMLSALKQARETFTSAPLKSKNSVAVVVDLDDGDLIDEDALLNENVLNAPTSIGERVVTSDDCGGRKPCDDCTCGRAEREANGGAIEGRKQVPSSSCGNCGKGDAFRCASCPYLGKPAFKAGEEHLVLDLSDDL